MKQRTKRNHLIMYLKVYNTIENEFLGHLGDITLEGLMILSDKPLDINKISTLKCMLPIKDNQARDLEIQAKCVWSNKDLNDQYYANGFKFHDIDDNTRLNIEHLIDDLGFN